MKNATPGKDWGVGGLAQGGVGVGSLFSGGWGGGGKSLLLASISLLYTDYYFNDMTAVGGFRLAGFLTVIAVLQHLDLPC